MNAPAASHSAGQDIFFDLVAADNPAPLLHRLRDEDPVHLVAQLGFWFVTRHDDVKRLFHDPEHVTQNRRAWEHYVPAPEGSLTRWLHENSLMAQGPNAHARFRRLFAGALTPRAVRRMDAQIRHVVDRFAAPLRGRRGEVLDLLGDFINPIPNAVISRIVGMSPGADEVRFRELAQDLIRGFFPFAPSEALGCSEHALQELAPWLRALVGERRKELRDDLISDLLRAQGTDASIDEDEIVMLVAVLVHRRRHRIKVPHVRPMWHGMAADGGGPHGEAAA